MAAPRRELDDLDDPLLNTAEIIEEARRPVLIERHRELVEDMEASLSDALVTGSADNPRLKRMLEELDAESEQTRIANTIRGIADDENYHNAELRQALIEEACLLRERQGIEIATLQLHVIGVYRRIRSLMNEQQCLVPALADLRGLPARRVGQLLTPMDLRFGSPQLKDDLIVAPTQAQETLQVIRTIMKAPNGDDHWKEATGDPPLPREAEEPLEKLPSEQRELARQRLVSDRIRSQFYRAIFLNYFGTNELSPEELDAHRTILHWFESIRETPHLYPFMQGQTNEQKLWRLGQLLRKIVQLNEIYQRVALAGTHPTYRERFKELTTREALAILAKDHYPAMKVDNDFLVSTMLCPFSIFASWVQEKVDSKDFVLPPDPKS